MHRHVKTICLQSEMLPYLTWERALTVLSTHQWKIFLLITVKTKAWYLIYLILQAVLKIMWLKQSQYFKIPRGIGVENLKIAFVCKARLTGVTFPLHNCGDKNSAWWWRYSWAKLLGTLNIYCMTKIKLPNVNVFFLRWSLLWDHCDGKRLLIFST